MMSVHPSFMTSFRSPDAAFEEEVGVSLPERAVEA
jgi:hypothetical protein